MNQEAIARAEFLMPSCLSLVNEVAAFILNAQSAFHAGHIEYKGENDLVSYVDREAERMLVEGLGMRLPESGFIGEEGAMIDVDADFRWIIDPLDGTTNFMHAVPHYCVSVGLQYKQQALMGIVKDVPTGECFHAIKTKGAFLDGKPIQVSQAANLQRTLLCMGFPYSDSGINIDDYLAVLKDFMGISRGMRRMGAAALDIAWVAAGRFDGFYEWGLQPWDVAAATLILQEAGGHATDFFGTDNFVFGRQVVATNGAIHDAMLGVIQKHYHR